MVKVLFFGRLKEELQSSQMQVQVADTLTVAELKQQLVSEQPTWQELLLDDQVLVAVDQVMATPATQVSANAEVAFFPPVTGG
ncbi:MAG TPA: molybdopterin converting factor subunit 1 [Oceanospirillaceae bacterium]|nr:molybdopterin converting factor subunit 1 [Oceanospirillaceae bacterium]